MVPETCTDLSMYATAQIHTCTYTSIKTILSFIWKKSVPRPQQNVTEKNFEIPFIPVKLTTGKQISTMLAKTRGKRNPYSLSEGL